MSRLLLLIGIHIRDRQHGWRLHACCHHVLVLRLLMLILQWVLKDAPLRSNSWHFIIIRVICRTKLAR